MAWEFSILGSLMESKHTLGSTVGATVELCPTAIGWFRVLGVFLLDEVVSREGFALGTVKFIFHDPTLPGKRIRFSKLGYGLIQFSL